MGIYSYLKKDHSKVNQLFEEIISSGNTKQRQNLFEELRDELLLHAKTEHDTFYKALKKHGEIKDKIKHADKEHDTVACYLDQLSEVSIKSDEWLVLLGELKYAVSHHVKTEEGEIFKEAKKILSKEQAKELAVKMDELKMKAQE